MKVLAAYPENDIILLAHPEKEGLGRLWTAEGNKLSRWDLIGSFLAHMPYFEEVEWEYDFEPVDAEEEEMPDWWAEYLDQRIINLGSDNHND